MSIEVNGLPQTNPARRAFMVVALIAASILGLGAITYAIARNSGKTDDLCEFVDADHNRERARIIEGERRLYTVLKDDFAVFTDTPKKQRAIHAVNKRLHSEVRITRPAYCAEVRKNPVKPYPSLEEIQSKDFKP